MSKGLLPAVSGSIAQAERLDTIANNLANADTDGFKRDQVSFQTVMSSALSAAQKEEIPRKPYTEKDFHKLDGRDSAYVVLEGTFTDHGQGRLKVTGGPLDVALEGKGFLEVMAPQGSRFTRHGSLRLNGDGALVTTEGFPVLSKGDVTVPAAQEELAARAIRLDPKQGSQVTITTDGKIYQGKNLVGELNVVEFLDTKLLSKEGNSLFANASPSNVSVDPLKTRLHQGMLETSNVNAVSEMTEMLKATRLYEANEKLVKSYGELESRAVNDIGKL